jgi:hypothetical protein
VSRLINEAGKRYGRLIVLGRAKPPEHGSLSYRRKAFWLCQCDCGNDTIANAISLRNGTVTSCGCFRSEKSAQFASELGRRPNDYMIVDVTGQRFGMLTVLCRAERRENQRSLYWQCRCDCGKIVEVRGTALRHGHTTSCGCKRRQAHGNAFKIKEVAGQRFGALVALRMVGDAPNGNGKTWAFKCDCGTEKTIRLKDVTSGNTRSCGCRRNLKRSMPDCRDAIMDA